MAVPKEIKHKMVAKAYRSGCPVTTAVSAPTSPAVELAEKSAIALICFLRGDEMNIYTHKEGV